MPTKKLSFDVRVVDFDIIHNQKPEDFQKFIEIINAQPNQRILEGMGGYGAVPQRILNSAAERGFIPEIYIVDESKVQLDFARKNLPSIPADHFVNADMHCTTFPNNMFDQVVIKMGIHEVPRMEQSDIFREVYRVLAQGGKFTTWELSFHDSETQKVFQDLIREKDRIAGFDTLVANRWFPRQDELFDLYNEAGFKNVVVAHAVNPMLTMRVRESELVSKDRIALQAKKGGLSEADERYLYELGKRRCDQLVAFAKKYMLSVSTAVKKRLSYVETADDFIIIPQKEILVGYKL